MSPNIPGNFVKYSGECHQSFRWMSLNIPGNVAKHSGECSQTIQRIFERWKYIIVLDTGNQELYLFVEEPLFLNSKKRKRACLSFLRKNKNAFNAFIATYLHVIDLIYMDCWSLRSSHRRCFVKNVFLKISQIS